MMMRKTVLLLALLVTSACASMPPTLDPFPHERPIAIRTCVPGATVWLDGAGVVTTPQIADTAGDTTFAAIHGSVTAFNLHATAPGRTEYGAVVPVDDHDHQFLIGSCIPITVPGWQVQLPIWTSPFVDTGERGAVHTDGVHFVRADGSQFAWHGTDGFLLYQHWLTERAGIDPVVQNWLTCGGLCNARGPNVIRVLGMVSWGPLFPAEHADYYDQLRPFVDHLWSTFHVRVEFVIFADAQIIMPDIRSVLFRHAALVMDALASAENVFIEVANEPFKNIPGGGTVAAEIGRTLVNRGLPVASGDYDAPWDTALTYLTIHGDRGDEWPRKAKDLLDVRNGDVGDAHPGWGGANIPVVGDEPMGFAEVAKPGSRSASESDAAHYAAACALFVSGCTFHSDAGTLYGLFGPQQAIAAAAFAQAQAFIPANAQDAQYMRGTDQPGCNAVGEPVIEHDDNREARSYWKILGNEAWAVQIRTTRTTATACPGWVIVEQPRPGLVRLRRQ